MNRSFIRTILAGFASLLLFASAASAEDSVRVGSKIDTEGSLLGNMIIAALGANGIPTTDKLQLGPTKIVRSALISGEIDLYPEYTGNGAFFFNKESDPAWRNADRGYELVKSLDAANKLVWLTPAPANNRWAIAVRQDVATANKLQSMDDFARWVGGGGNVKLAASAEFVESPAALPSFQETYKFKLKPDQIVVLAGGNTAATIRAAAEQTSGVNAAMAYGTDGALAAVGLVVMSDPKGAQIVYEPTPVIRAETLQKYPKIKDVLQPIFASLTEQKLQQLNAKIAVEGEPAKDVARSYLKSIGALK
jgi:osmoprotectant transport system substrate-binding protein